MFIPLAIPLATQLLITVAADRVPTYDVTPSCRAAAEANSAQDRLQTCLKSEQSARDELVKKWSEYPASDRSLCAQTAAVGGEPTYTELITCLEMAHDVRNPPPPEAATPAPTTSGAANGGATPGMLHLQPRRSDMDGSK